MQTVVEPSTSISTQKRERVEYCDRWTTASSDLATKYNTLSSFFKTVFQSKWLAKFVSKIDNRTNTIKKYANDIFATKVSKIILFIYKKSDQNLTSVHIIKSPVQFS